MEQIKQIHNF